MCKRRVLKERVLQRLVAAAEDIFALIEQTLEEHEAELLLRNQHREGVQIPERSKEELTPCVDLHLPFGLLKSEGDIGEPSVLQCESGDEDGRGAEEEPGCSSEPQTLQHEKSPDMDYFEDWAPPAGNTTDTDCQGNAPSPKRRKLRKRRHELTESSVSVKKEREELPESYVQSGAVSDTHLPPFSLAPRPHSKPLSKNKPVTCPECGVTLRREYSLERHISAVHRKERPYACPVCERAFAQKADCVIHMSTHTGERPHVCAVCHRRFGFKKSLQRHMKQHAPQTGFMTSGESNRAQAW